MIWSITSKKEMEELNTPSVFRYYQEALGRENIQLAVVDETDNLDFISKEDIVLLRTASELLINTIRKKGVRTTAEDFRKYELVRDKAKLARWLTMNGIRVPHQYHQVFGLHGKTYFVKPRYGSDSVGISELNICHTADEIRVQTKKLDPKGKGDVVIEDFINGREFTVVCIKGFPLRTFVMEVICTTNGGIQTYESKKNYMEVGCKVYGDLDDRAKRIASDVFSSLGLQHHARIDMRCDNEGNLYVIDVNLLPGLGPIGDLARCLLLTENMSYIDALKAVIASAS